MPLFLIERQFGEQLEELTRETVAEINGVNDEVGIDWIYSFLSADRKKTYCLYEAPSVEAIREAASTLGLPADAIVEVTQLQPKLMA